MNHERRKNLGVAVFFRVSVEVIVHHGALKPCSRSAVYMETRAGYFGCGVGVKNT